MRIAYLALYPPDTAPSQRFRVEQYLPYLSQENIAVDTYPFYSSHSYNILYAKGKPFSKALWILRDYMLRLLLLPRLRQYDKIWIQRGATPLGPPLAEWIIARLLQKPIVYDFDDAIWIPDPESNIISRLLKSYSKIASICRLAEVVIVGNEYLANYAKQHSSNVEIIPTVVDTDYKYLTKRKQKTQPVNIGWTGSHSTLRHLQLIEKALLELEGTDFTFTIISNSKPEFLNLPFKYIPWNKKNEIEALSSFDIGIMPLIEDPWSLGKCGFKAIQYMALGIPPVVSPVGVNSKIVDHEKSGYHATTEEEWIKYLSLLIDNYDKRIELGTAARDKVEHFYSINAALPKLKKVISKV